MRDDTPTEMESRVSLEIALEYNGYKVESGDDMFLNMARAAIRAMRNPTATMIRDGADSQSDFMTAFWGGATALWQAMIDSASPPEDRGLDQSAVK